MARFHGDGVAELFELVDQAAGAVFGGAAALGPVRAEVGVVDLIIGTTRHDLLIAYWHAAADVGGGEVRVRVRGARAAGPLSAARPGRGA